MLSSPRRHAVSVLLGFVLIAGCSNPTRPVGRWEGVHEDGSLIVAARLEIERDGTVRVSAPNAIADIASMSDADRSALRDRLLSELSQSWLSVKTARFDFDGKAFRKPGGVAPQLEWDPASKRMTMIYYQYGNRSSVRVPLDKVSDFGNGNS